MQNIRPLPDESFERYTIRAHRALQRSIPDPQRRNNLIRRMWSRIRGATETEQIARQAFAPDRYERVPDVCVFAEHTVRDGEGKERRFTLRELASIVRNCNERIADVGAYPAIVDGHTSDPDDPAPKDPQILGYAGGYRLGQIGRKNPRWAIFQDEYRLKTAKDTLDRKPRRSVELWTYQDTGRAHFDPIAALGAEAPRLPLPIRFSTFRHEGATVQRYSAAAAPVMAGGSNTFVPKPMGRQKPKKAATPMLGRKSTKTSYQEPTGMLSPEDKAELVDAISSLPQFQFLDRLMQSPKCAGLMDGGLDDDDQQAAMKMAADEEADDDALDLDLPPEDEGGGEGDGLGDDAAGGDGLQAAAEGDDDLADLSDLLEEEDGKPKKFMQQAYSSKRGNGRVMKYQAVVTKYAALQKSHQRLIKEHGKLHGRVQVMERETTDAKRMARLRQLESDYPHVVSADEEAAATLYSHGASLSDEQFEQHVATVTKFAQRSSPVTRMIPGGENPISRANAQRADYAAKRSEIAVQICTEAASHGKPMSWEEGLAKADERLKSN